MSSSSLSSTISFVETLFHVHTRRCRILSESRELPSVHRTRGGELRPFHFGSSFIESSYVEVLLLLLLLGESHQQSTVKISWSREITLTTRSRAFPVNSTPPQEHRYRCRGFFEAREKNHATRRNPPAACCTSAVTRSEQHHQQQWLYQ